MARLRTRTEDQVDHTGVLDVIGRGHLYPTVRSAVEAGKAPDHGAREDPRN
jgi:hypothetical protein